MIFEQILTPDLGCASYLVGCQRAEAAFVVDPPLDVSLVEAALARHDARLIGVVETHTHADHVSGHGVLALEDDVPVHVHALADAAYPHEPLADADRLVVGSVELVAIHTPGHRPEHTCFAVVDRTRADEPWLLLSGDSLFVGDVARPDLAVAGAEGAADLYASLQERVLTLADGVEVFPGHVAGSLCGRGMNAKTSTTIGFERRHNAMLEPVGVAAFTAAATTGLAPKPPNIDAIVALNRGPFVGRPPTPERLLAVPADSPVLDVRPSAAFAAGHRRGALHVPVDRSGFATRAGFLLPPGGPPVLVCEDGAQALAATRRLNAVGFLHVAGWLTPAEAGADEAFAIAAMDDLDTLQVLDVRDLDETPAALPGAVRVPVGELADADLGGLDPARATAVVCSTGSRAGIGAALLARRGFGDVRPLLDGGMSRASRNGRS